MVELAGAILIVIGVIVGAAIALTLVYLAVDEWRYMYVKLRWANRETLGGITGNTEAIKTGEKP